MELTAGEIAAAVSGRLIGADRIITSVSIDSRQVEPSALFVPIVADRDGHEFIGAALEAGAIAYLTDREPDFHTSGASAIVVGDTAAALSALGRAARSLLPDRIVGVTGSVGKTSTKDLIAGALGAGFATHASHLSFNNELGVPLTLVNAPDGTDAVVVEMGARGAGHIRALCDVAAPTIGVVTVVGQAHTELFGTIEDVAAAKGELIEALPSGGTAVLNADDQRVATMAERTDADVLTFGVSACDVRIRDLRVDDLLRPRFRIETPEGEHEVALRVAGEHNALNAAAALAVAMAADLDLDLAAAALAEAELSPHRMDLQVAPSGARILNDAYNANPVSLRAALHALVEVPADRRVAVLGVMAELGAEREQAHREMGDLGRSLGIEIVSVDEPAYGVPVVDSIEEALAAIGKIDARTAVLVKGSRIAGLERLAAALLSPSEG